MNTHKVYRAVGLMSGTSLDGVDAALIETDGRGSIAPIEFGFMPYDDDLRARIRTAFGARKMNGDIKALERDVTLFHADLTQQLLADHSDVDVIGFHGQTLTHDPARKFTWQIGDGALLARETGVCVVNNFRENDVAQGGQGAPLIPLYHSAIAKNKNIQNVLFINVGGVSNVTFVGASEADILAFDCGAGNALMDDFMAKRTYEKFDKDGQKAAAGNADLVMVEEWLSAPYFDAPIPKSLDRDAWDVRGLNGLSLEDGLASLLEFTARGIKASLVHLPQPLEKIYVCGGGRHNKALMDRLAALMPAPVQPIEALGFDGDATEAEGFGYLAVRTLEGLPISLPSTTGAPTPLRGGDVFE